MNYEELLHECGRICEQLVTFQVLQIQKHDARLQIRIVAEHIVQKLERRYEERMEREMGRQRERAERRINQLREEYNMARKELMNTVGK